MNLFLIGYRGTGKSTVGRLLAQRLGWPFVDSDDEIERRAGMTIAEIFVSEGESGFRDREADVVIDLAARSHCVVALGGGSVLREENRSAIAGGRTIWLQAAPETIYQRVHADQSTARRRPNLTTAGGLDEILEILQQREPIYKSCADVIIDTEAKPPEQVADEIIQAVSADIS